jgi:hypothetical protein
LFSGTTPSASAVRAIDSNVVQIITLAATEGETGTNNSGGGVNVYASGGRNSLLGLGYYSVVIQPAGALAAGAGWQILQLSASTPNTYYSDSDLDDVVGGNYTFSFKTVPGYATPANFPLQIANGSNYTITATYSALTATFAAPRLSGTNFLVTVTAPAGQNLALDRSTNLTTWIPLVTNLVPTNGSLTFTNAIPPNHPGGTFFRGRFVP